MNTAESTALAIPERTELVALFRRDGGLDPIIARIEAEVRAHVPDVTTKRGRDAIASLAYRVARSKTALDDAGKALTEEQRRQISVVDAARRSVRDRLDALRDEARKPLDDWEATEKDRVDGIKARLQRLADAAPADGTSDSIAAMIARVEATAIDDTWQEFAADAAKAKDATLSRLRDAADLARLRAEAARAEAARAEADRIAAERAAEDERQRQAAEAEAARAAEHERLAAVRAAQIEREKAEAASLAAKEAETRAKEEADRKAREAAEREAELQRQLAASKAREEAAAQAERDRIAEAARAEEEARAKRAADAAHRARIQGAIAGALEAYMEMGAMGVADAIIGGAIPHVRVTL